MKKLYNIFDEKTYPKSKFDKFMEKVTAMVILVGFIFFLLIIVSIIKQNISIEFYNKINPIAFFKTHGVNFKVIWNDCSPYIVAWFVFVFVPLVMWSANNYKLSLRNEYLVKTTSKLCALNLEIDELKAANKILRESNMRLFEKTPAARLRDEEGKFLPKLKK